MTAHDENTKQDVRDALLEVCALHVVASEQHQSRTILNNVSFSIPSACKVALVGESGCGKTMTALCILRLVSQPSIRIMGGQVLFHATDLLTLSEKHLRLVRGDKISMVFQEPMTCLNPVLSIGYQIVETLQAHRKISKKMARSQAIHWLQRVGIPNPHRAVDAYPHELSGGMRQRVMIAIAMCCEPELLIADEPTTALDVTIQAQIIDLLSELVTSNSMSTLLITHDLGLVAGFADRVVVMYSGQVMEIAPVISIFQSPAHPYTRSLLRSLHDQLDDSVHGPHFEKAKSTIVTHGALSPKGCCYRDRCLLVQPVCYSDTPPWVMSSDDAGARCHLAQGKVLDDTV